MIQYLGEIMLINMILFTGIKIIRLNVNKQVKERRDEERGELEKEIFFVLHFSTSPSSPFLFQLFKLFNFVPLCLWLFVPE